MDSLVLLSLLFSFKVIFYLLLNIIMHFQLSLQRSPQWESLYARSLWLSLCLNGTDAIEACPPEQE